MLRRLKTQSPGPVEPPDEWTFWPPSGPADLTLRRWWHRDVTPEEADVIEAITQGLGATAANLAYARDQGELVNTMAGYWFTSFKTITAICNRTLRREAAS